MRTREKRIEAKRGNEDRDERFGKREEYTQKTSSTLDIRPKIPLTTKVIPIFTISISFPFDLPVFVLVPVDEENVKAISADEEGDVVVVEDSKESDRVDWSEEEGDR